LAGLGELLAELERRPQPRRDLVLLGRRRYGAGEQARGGRQSDEPNGAHGQLLIPVGRGDSTSAAKIEIFLTEETHNDNLGCLGRKHDLTRRWPAASDRPPIRRSVAAILRERMFGSGLTREDFQAVALPDI
jgi:hypothetical protein